MKAIWVRVSVIGLILATCSAVASTESGIQKTTVAYRKADGHEILADVYRPKDSSVRPVIMYIHGGALIMGNRELDSPQIRARRASRPGSPDFDVLEFAEKKGYAVVSIDYRLAPETKLPAIVSDVEAAFIWLGGEGAKRFYFDPARIVVLGGSAGGYLTLVTGFRVKPKPRALVALYGYGDLSADWYAKPNPYPYYNQQKITREEMMQQTAGTALSNSDYEKDGRLKIYMYYRQNGLWSQEVSGFNPESFAREIAPYEPVKNVTREYPPTLLIHGTQDSDVPFEESLKMSAQFRQHGVPYILLPIDKGEHGFVGGNETELKEAYKTMEEFMTRYLEAQ